MKLQSTLTRARITDSSAAAASSSSKAAFSDCGAAGASPGVVKVSLSDDESSDHTSTAKDHITEVASWEAVYTLMMIFEGITGRPEGSSNCFDTLEMPTFSLQQGQLKVIRDICDHLLYGYSRSGATEHGDSECIRTNKDIAMLISNMSKALDYRASLHPVDKILSEEEVGKTYVEWMHEWIRTELRQDQKGKKHNSKTSIFAAYVRNTFGSKAFLMAMLQYGPNLMPSGAAKHACDFPDKQTRAVKCLEELLEWLSSFADAFTDHRSKEEMQEARQRSGTQRGQSGLTPEQHQRRAWRNNGRPLAGRKADSGSSAPIS